MVEGFTLTLSNGCLCAVLSPEMLGFAVLALVLVALSRMFAGDATLNDLLGLARFGVGPLLESVDDMLDPNDAPGSRCRVSASSLKGVGGDGSS